MLKKVFSIITTMSISLCCCNIVFAEEIPIVTEHQERTITEPEEMLVVENLELEGYEKSYDEESGLYVFTQINDETNSLTDDISERATNALPDLSAEILSPKSGTNINGPKNEDDVTNITFNIINKGGAMSGSNFICTITVDGKKLQSFYVNPMKASSYTKGTFNIYFKTYGPVTLGIEVDSAKEVTESNENNNVGTANYNIVYCTHKSTSCFLLYPGNNLSVQVKNNAIYGFLTRDFYSENLGAWNGITDKCRVTRAFVSDATPTDADILIYADAQKVGQGYRASSVTLHENEHDYTEVVINNKEMGNDSISACCRTLIHELGHVFTLAHPTCSYESIMWQSSTQKPPKSDEITFHDAYGVYDAYNNARNGSNENEVGVSKSSKIQIVTADLAQPIENINDIENMAQYIVKGKILDDSKNILPEYGSGYTKTGLEITDVYKGDLNTGDVITLTELYYTSKDGVEIRREGYSASTPGEEYLFYLGPQYEDGTYGIVCTVLGRYSLEDTQALSDDTESIEANIAEEYAPLYQQLKTEVMNLYKK